MSAASVRSAQPDGQLGVRQYVSAKLLTCIAAALAITALAQDDVTLYCRSHQRSVISGALPDDHVHSAHDHRGLERQRSAVAGVVCGSQFCLTPRSRPNGLCDPDRALRAFSISSLSPPRFPPTAIQSGAFRLGSFRRFAGVSIPAFIFTPDFSHTSSHSVVNDCRDDNVADALKYQGFCDHNEDYEDEHWPSQG